jgi:uncharacterized membrane protein HdeD (DUF308 family)
MCSNRAKSFSPETDRRIVLGVELIVLGVIVLSWPSGQTVASISGAFLGLLGLGDQQQPNPQSVNF